MRRGWIGLEVSEPHFMLRALKAGTWGEYPFLCQKFSGQVIYIQLGSQHSFVLFRIPKEGGGLWLAEVEERRGGGGGGGGPVACGQSCPLYFSCSWSRVGEPVPNPQQAAGKNTGSSKRQLGPFSLPASGAFSL